MGRLAGDALSRAPQWLTRPNWKSCGHGPMREDGWQRKRESTVRDLLLIYSVWLIFSQLLFSLPRCLTHLFTETHTPIWQKHSLSLSPPIYLSLSSLRCESLSTHHDWGLGWPPVLIRESVMSSSQSLTTHQRNTAWSKLTLTSNMGRTSLDAACVFG